MGTIKTGRASDSMPTVSEVLTRYYDDTGNERADRSNIKYKTLATNADEFDKERGKATLIKDVDLSWYKLFAAYLMNKEGNFNAMINKKQSQIITAISDYLDNDPYGKKLKGKITEYTSKHNLKEIQAPKFPLLPQELDDLRAFDGYANDYHRMVGNAFLLACETGLRYSDVIQLKPAHIMSVADGDTTIYFASLNNIKGSKKNEVALTDRAMKILERYANGAECYFKFSHSQVAGKILKEIFSHEDLKLNRACEVVQAQGNKVTRTIEPLHDVISFHTARNTFITMCNNSGLSVAYTRENVGHGDIKTTMGYQRDMPIERFRATLKVLE